MLELYNAPASTCSQRVRQALSEKDLAWEDRRISLADHEHLTPAYLELNPNGLVPTLVHDGQAIPDSTVILEYLEDVFPQTPLRPAIPVARARMREWCQFIDEVPTPATRIPSFHHLFGKAIRQMSPSQLEAYAEGRPMRRDMYRRIGPNGFSDQDLAQAREQLAYALGRMQRSLAETLWLADDAFTLADISMLPTLVRLEDLGMETLWKGLPAVEAWSDRIRARTSFDVAYYPGSRIRPVA